MGRAKMKMELISSVRKRNKAFKRRKDGLITKIHELTTLCDVSACMIIYGPKQDKGDAVSPPVVWPESSDEVQQMIESYKAKEKDSGCKKFELKDFFRDKTKKVEEQLAKLRKQNLEAKYPAPTEIIDNLSEQQLRVFAGKLKEKAEFIRSRVQMLKMIMANQSQSFYNPPASGLVKHEQLMNQQNFSMPLPVNNYLGSNCYNQHQYPYNQNLMKSELDCYAQIDSYTQFNRQVLYDSTETQWAILNQNSLKNQDNLYSHFGGEIANNASSQFGRKVFCDQARTQWVVDQMAPCQTTVPLEWYSEQVQRQAPSSSDGSVPQQQLQILARENDFGSCQDDELLRLIMSSGKMHQG